MREENGVESRQSLEVRIPTAASSFADPHPLSLSLPSSERDATSGSEERRAQHPAAPPTPDARPRGSSEARNPLESFPASFLRADARESSSRGAEEFVGRAWASGGARDAPKEVIGESAGGGSAVQLAPLRAREATERLRSGSARGLSERRQRSVS
ncbi:hypothetical protein KM043_004096 [Ampulex compressa]|nr:hypothetical protein KM043_004096 [Ampulex compressa]